MLLTLRAYIESTHLQLVFFVLDNFEATNSIKKSYHKSKIDYLATASHSLNSHDPRKL